MSEFGLALLVALTGWWFSTGVILWLVHRSQRHHRKIFALSTLTMLLAFYGVAASVYESTPQSVVLAFCSGAIALGLAGNGLPHGLHHRPQKSGLP